MINIFSNKKENYTIKDIIKMGKAGGTPTSTNPDYYNGDIPFLSISDMTEQGKHIYHTEKSITELGLRNSTAWVVPKNSIVISMYASYGLVALNNIELTTSQAMYSMILKEEFNIEYLYQYLNYLYQINYYDKLVSTGTQSNLNADKINKLSIFIPSKLEQEKIADLLKNFDKKFDLEKTKLTIIIDLKKGLMQNMFV